MPDDKPVDFPGTKSYCEKAQEKIYELIRRTDERFSGKLSFWVKAAVIAIAGVYVFAWSQAEVQDGKIDCNEKTILSVGKDVEYLTKSFEENKAQDKELWREQKTLQMLVLEEIQELKK